MVDLELAAHEFCRIVELEFKVIKHELVGLEENVLVNLASMEVDSPFYFEHNLTSAPQVLVDADLFVVFDLLVIDET